MINVTKSYLPPLSTYTKYLEGIWERNWVTNHGPLVAELEEKLKNYFKVKHLFFVKNGTTALQISIKALDLKGEVITTPFSYVATTSSLVWERCKPIFADINPTTLCLDPNQVEKSITKKTTGILATHVYGIPCDVEKLQKISKKHGLKLIYDAAHAFGVKVNGKSILNHGDISTLSFHATKLFHTGEGGAIVTNDDVLAHKISYLRNFGHKGQEDFWGLGINGKNSELHAAMGLSIFPKINQLIEKRKYLTSLYEINIKSNRVSRPKVIGKVEYNYSYFPLLFETEELLLKVKEALNKKDIQPRRYFFPSLNKLNYVKKQAMPVSEDIARRVLCLPLFYDLKRSEVNLISGVVNEAMVK